jgi:thiamine-phosphate diphosphorylase
MDEALRAGVRLFQYRAKHETRKRIYEVARDLAAVSRSMGALFIVNDHADIALAVGAHGVHLGQDDLPIDRVRMLLGPSGIIGISTHNVEQAVLAARQGADYIGFGPVFRTSTKNAGVPKGLDGLAAARSSVLIPIIAIGGITRENAGSAVRSGADSVAVISAVLGTSDIAGACRSIIDAMQSQEDQKPLP